MKWDMGWMHDTLQYMEKEPVFRRFHHDHLTFRMLYAFSENFTLPLSHDEVVHGKGSLLDKMPGPADERFANLRLLLAWLCGQPGKKLLFMGDEIAQGREWDHDASLDWHLLESSPHAGMQAWVRDLNRLYRDEPALHALDCDPRGFEWVDCCDLENSVVTFLRHDGAGRSVLAAFNFTPVPRTGYRVGVPRDGHWNEALNSDAAAYGGQGWGNFGGIDSEPVAAHGRASSLVLTLPPLGALFFTAP
jgi:1,4-alpha-glucan branching enzyme